MLNLKFLVLLTLVPTVAWANETDSADAAGVGAAPTQPAPKQDANADRWAKAITKQRGAEAPRGNANLDKQIQQAKDVDVKIGRDSTSKDRAPQIGDQNPQKPG